MKTSYLFYFSLVLVIGCQLKPPSPEAVPVIRLSPEEIRLCDSVQMDSGVVSLIRHYSLGELKRAPDAIPGLAFEADSKNSRRIVNALSDTFHIKGYSIFLLDERFGRRPDIIGILKSPDKYEVLKQVKTDGVNLKIDNDSLIRIIKRFDARYSLDLVAAGSDWCEFRINNPPPDWMELAKEVYKVCPDVVDQGTRTLEELAREMRQSERLYLWWD